MAIICLHLNCQTFHFILPFIPSLSLSLPSCLLFGIYSRSRSIQSIHKYGQIELNARTSLHLFALCVCVCLRVSVCECMCTTFADYNKSFEWSENNSQVKLSASQVESRSLLFFFQNLLHDDCVAKFSPKSFRCWLLKWRLFLSVPAPLFFSFCFPACIVYVWHKKRSKCCSICSSIGR